MPLAEGKSASRSVRGKSTAVTDERNRDVRSGRDLFQFRVGMAGCGSAKHSGPLLSVNPLPRLAFIRAMVGLASSMPASRSQVQGRRECSWESSTFGSLMYRHPISSIPVFIAGRSVRPGVFTRLRRTAHIPDSQRNHACRA